MASEALPSACEPEYLTDVLRRSGALGDGRVTSVDVMSSRLTILSRIIRLRLSIRMRNRRRSCFAHSEDRSA
jgi:hypothetical protein